MRCMFSFRVKRTGASGGWTCLLAGPLLPGYLLLAFLKLPFSRGVSASSTRKQSNKEIEGEPAHYLGFHVFVL